jgi:hypothetical protein
VHHEQMKVPYSFGIDFLLDLVTWSLMRGVQMGEISKLGWLMGFVEHESAHMAYGSRCTVTFDSHCRIKRKPSYYRRFFLVLGIPL